MSRQVVMLCGGVGGARLAHGMYHALSQDELTLIVNTGDDFEHWGLQICPDLDTVMYSLADLAQVERGWGLETESFEALDMVKRYGGEDWFALGDRDLATHLMRSQRLREGHSLTSVTQGLASSLGVHCSLLPMSDDSCASVLMTEDWGPLSFQQWFVKHQAKPTVRDISWAYGANAAGQVQEALAAADLVVIAPSNPYVSIDPILQLPKMDNLLERPTVIAVSPIVHGEAVKGPLAQMIRDLSGQAPSPAAVARHYGECLDAMIMESGEPSDALSVQSLRTSTIMKTRDDSRRLADRILEFTESSLK